MARLVKQVEGKHTFDSIIGSSQALKYAEELATRVAITDSMVLLEGETGVGKDFFAKAIHAFNQGTTSLFWYKGKATKRAQLVCRIAMVEVTLVIIIFHAYVKQ